MNSRVRPTVLHREAETGKRRMSGLETIGILADIRIPHGRRDQIVAGDIAGSSAGELIRFFDEVVIIFEER
jgi:hypothetical protein